MVIVVAVTVTAAAVVIIVVVVAVVVDMRLFILPRRLFLIKITARLAVVI